MILSFRNSYNIPFKKAKDTIVSIKSQSVKVFLNYNLYLGYISNPLQNYCVSDRIRNNYSNYRSGA